MARVRCKNPDPSRPATYPADIKKNNEPACAWVMDSSFSIVGSSGERIILPMKFTKKITTKKKTGLSWDQKLAPGISELAAFCGFGTAAFRMIMFDAFLLAMERDVQSSLFT